MAAVVPLTQSLPHELFEKAAAKGHSGAMFALGAMHGGGHGFPIDRATAQRGSGPRRNSAMATHN